MQQRPVRTSSALASRVALVAIATVAAVPLVGRPARGHGGPDRRAPGDHVSATPNATAASGNVAADLAPALPRRTPATVTRVDELAALLGLAPTPAVPAPVAMSARERVLLGAVGTYIGEILRVPERDSSIVRWPERTDRPLTVWIGNGRGLTDWHPTYLARVADAFGEWTRTGVPVRFRFVQDSGAAEVHVAWTDHFHKPISGQTIWSHDEHWWMTNANITLALHHNDGAPLDDDQVHAIALHEIGHLLGLDHTSDSMSVMAARVRVRELSNADQATARLVYAVPAGHL